MHRQLRAAALVVGGILLGLGSSEVIHAQMSGLTSKQIFNDIGQEPLDIATDRIMMCGSPAMLDELKQMFEQRGFLEGSNSAPGHFVIEKAFVER